MKDDGVVAQPLTDVEIQQLDDFLTSEPTPEGAMDISMMDGFMSALASGPTMMMRRTELYNDFVTGQSPLAYFG